MPNESIIDADGLNPGVHCQLHLSIRHRLISSLLSVGCHLQRLPPHLHHMRGANGIVWATLTELGHACVGLIVSQGCHGKHYCSLTYAAEDIKSLDHSAHDNMLFITLRR